MNRISIELKKEREIILYSLIEKGLSLDEIICNKTVKILFQNTTDKKRSIRKFMYNRGYKTVNNYFIKTDIKMNKDVLLKFIVKLSDSEYEKAVDYIELKISKKNFDRMDYISKRYKHLTLENLIDAIIDFGCNTIEGLE